MLYSSVLTTESNPSMTSILTWRGLHLEFYINPSTFTIKLGQPAFSKMSGKWGSYQKQQLHTSSCCSWGSASVHQHRAFSPKTDLQLQWFLIRLWEFCFSTFQTPDPSLCCSKSEHSSIRHVFIFTSWIHRENFRRGGSRFCGTSIALLMYIFYKRHLSYHLSPSDSWDGLQLLHDPEQDEAGTENGWIDGSMDLSSSSFCLTMKTEIKPAKESLLVFSL